jgi:hypothetical protein
VRHGPCAVCDNDDNTTRLCSACKADPANADWCEGDERLIEDVDAEASVRPRLAAQSPPRRIPTLLHRRVLELAALHTLPTWVRRRVRRDGNRVWEWRQESRALGYREIAFLLGCSKSYCQKTYRAVAD